jgi:hypothetical protein
MARGIDRTFDVVVRPLPSIEPYRNQTDALELMKTHAGRSGPHGSGLSIVLYSPTKDALARSYFESHMWQKGKHVPSFLRDPRCNYRDVNVLVDAEILGVTETDHQAPVFNSEDIFNSASRFMPQDEANMPPLVEQDLTESSGVAYDLIEQPMAEAPISDPVGVPLIVDQSGSSLELASSIDNAPQPPSHSQTSVPTLHNKMHSPHPHLDALRDRITRGLARELYPVRLLHLTWSQFFRI